MEIEYELTLDDLLEYNVYHWQHSPSIRRSLTIGHCGLAVVIACITIYLGYPNFKYQTSLTLKLLPMLPGVIIVVCDLLFFEKVFWLRSRKNAERLYKEGKLKDTIGKKYLTLTQDEIIGKSTSSEIKTKWSGVEKVVDTDRQILIYFAALNAYLIPKRTFPDKAKCSEFIETAKKFHADAAREK